VLQGFPADLPVAGGRTSQFRQVGNAIPPPMAAAVLRSLLE
jgi:DNA (cytosine-5)-methyltransferase 1